jgi:hypothetical protein
MGPLLLIIGIIALFIMFPPVMFVLLIIFIGWILIEKNSNY